MDKLAIEKLLLELPKSSYGAALKVFLEEELGKVDSIDGIKTIEEVKGKQIAKEIIKKIFAFYKVDKSSGQNKNRYL
jgi:predicted N-acyltransferase